MKSLRGVDHEEEINFGELEGSLGFLLRIAQVRNFEKFYAAFDALGLRPGEFSVLWLMRLNPGVRQGQLAENLKIKPAQMSKMIRRLEEHGRIRRLIPDHDRRSVRLYLTKDGEDFTNAHRDDFFGQDHYHRHDLSELEAKQLARLLQKYSGF